MVKEGKDLIKNEVDRKLKAKKEMVKEGRKIVSKGEEILGNSSDDLQKLKDTRRRFKK